MTLDTLNSGNSGLWRSGHIVHSADDDMTAKWLLISLFKNLSALHTTVSIRRERLILICLKRFVISKQDIYQASASDISNFLRRLIARIAE